MDQITSIFKILSDETRLRVIVLLYQEELCVCELAGILDVPQPRVSKNLSKLRDLNLVNDERKERYVFYTLKKDNITLNSILKTIFDNFKNYPQLVEDKERLKNREDYINICCSI